MSNRWAWFALVILAAASATAQQAGVRLTAEQVDRHYNRLHSLQADFTETYSGGGTQRSESGTLWMKKPGCMRWEYRQPRAKFFITDGKTAWFYVPEERQARRAEIKKMSDLRSPLRYLLGHSRLEEELHSLSLAPDRKPETPGAIVLRGVPAGMEDRIAEVRMEIGPAGSILRIYIEELDGSTTDFRLRGERDDVTVGDERFRFQPPPGVEVMQSSELQP